MTIPSKRLFAARYQIYFTVTQPLIHLSSQLTSLLRPSILTITNDSWQHRHHAAMREQGGGNKESRKFGVIPQRHLPQPRGRRRFFYSSCLGGICGQGEVLNYPVHVSCPTFPEDHNAASPHGLCCAIGRAKKWLTCLILEYQDARRNPQGGSTYASRPSLTVRVIRAYFTTYSQVGGNGHHVGSADTDGFLEGVLIVLSLSLTRNNTYEAVPNYVNVFYGASNSWAAKHCVGSHA